MKENVFNNAPKYWYMYINAFLYGLIRKNFTKALMDTTFFIKYIGILVNKLHEKKYYFPVCNSNNTCYMKETGSTTTKPDIFVKERLQKEVMKLVSSSYKITEIIGNIHTHGIFLETNFRIRFKLIFQLHNHLAMNFTFQHVHIPTAYSCFSEYVMFKVSFTKFFICGLHSMFTYIPKQEDFVMWIRKHLYETYMDVYFSFSVMDKRRMFTIQTGEYTLLKNTQYTHFFALTRTVLGRKWIKVNYTHVVIVLPVSLDPIVNIYDGPGILSPILKPSKKGVFKVLISRSFQCLIVTKYLHTRSGLSKRFKAVYSQKENKIFKNYSLKHESFIRLSFPDSNCTTAVCIFHLITNPGLFINVKINNITSSFTESMLCDYGGIAVYSKKENISNKISSLCHVQSSTYSYQNIYSNSSRVMIALYLYKEYGEFSINLTITTTRCPLIIIDVCYIENDYAEATSCLIVQLKQLNNILSIENNLYSNLRFCEHSGLNSFPLIEDEDHRYFLHANFRGEYFSDKDGSMYLLWQG